MSNFDTQPDPNDRPLSRSDYAACLVIACCIAFMVFLFLYPQAPLDKSGENFDNYDPNDGNTIQGTNDSVYGPIWPMEGK